MHSQAAEIARHLINVLPEELKQSWIEQNKYIKYQDDPVGFGEEVLGERYTDDVKAMMESVRDNRITVAMSATGVGKTHSAASVAIWFYKCHQPGAQVWTAAAPPEDNLRKLLWGQIAEKMLKIPYLFVNDRVGDLNIQRTTGGAKKIVENSFITGVTIPQAGTESVRESKFSGKHAPYLLFILDEGDAIPDEVYRGIDGCMSGGFARLLIMFNPKHETGAAYRLIEEGRANVVNLTALWHPNVVTGRNVMPGAVTRNVTVKRINESSFPLPADAIPDNDCFEIPEFLVGVVAKDDRGNKMPPLQAGWRKISETAPEFYYKVLGRYPSKGSDKLISREWVNAARTRWDLWVAQYGENPPIGVRPILGQDVADLGDDYNVTCKRYGGWVARLDKWEGVDPSETAERVAEDAKYSKSLVVNVDSIGVGADVAPLLRKKGVKANRIMVSNKPTKKPIGEEKCVFGILRDQLWWEVRMWLKEDPGSMLPPDEKLLRELVIPTYEVRLGKIKVMEKAKMKKVLGRSPDSAEALILTFAPDAIRPKVWSF